MKLSGNTILITGGSSGIGFEMARLLSEKNKVLICGRSLEKLREAKQKLPDLQIFQCDISNAEDCHQLFNWVVENHPSCNVLINNAAIVHRSSFALEDEAIHQAELEFQTNLLGPVRLCKLFMPLIQSNANGRIIQITTGLIYAPRSLYPFYNASKAALHSFTQVLRMQLKATRMKIVEVMMPVVDTPWHRGNAPKMAISPEKAVKQMMQQLEKGKLEIRVGKVKMLYLLSRMAPKFALKMINRIL